MSDQATRYEPSAADPRIIAVLEARARVDAAMASGDTKTTLSLVAPDLIVNAPINRVVDFANFSARLANSQIEYSAFETKLEFVGVRGDMVVLMGEEIATPAANTPNAGHVVRRRFTDIWRKIDGAWRLCIRQGTAISVL